MDTEGYPRFPGVPRLRRRRSLSSPRIPTSGTEGVEVRVRNTAAALMQRTFDGITGSDAEEA